MESGQSVVITDEHIYRVHQFALLDKAVDVLREEFHQYFSSDPETLYQEIKTHHKELKSLYNQRLIHRNEYATLFPPTGKTNSLEFEFTTLFFLLITLCPIQAPVTGWKTQPMSSDESKGANLIRIRINRSKLLQKNVLDIRDYTDIWNRITSSLQAFGCDKKELLALKSASQVHPNYAEKIEYAQSVVMADEHSYRLLLIALLDKAADVFRDEFHQYFSTDPKELYTEIKKHDKKLKLLLKQRVIHRDQYATLLPATGRTNSSEFDIPILSFALITFCPIPAPATGWKTLPLPSDTSKGANLIRIHYDRNKPLHKNMGKKRFNHMWNRIASALEEFGCDKQELVALKSASHDPIKAQKILLHLQRVVELEHSLEGFTYNLFSPTASFVGRGRELTELHGKLTMMDETQKAMVLYGLGGVGKSDLARQYCNRFAETYYKRNVIWINAEDINTMTEDFHQVAERIPSSTSNEKGVPLSIKSVVNRVYRYFADCPVLVVFDNVRSKSDLMEFMEINAPTNVSILITSQIAEWSERFIQLRIDVLSQEDAFTLISQSLNQNCIVNDNSTKLLCEKLQYLPLALQQCIAYINRWSITTEVYLEKFQNCADQIFKTCYNNEMYNKIVVTTWNMALNELKTETNTPLAITLLNFMSYLDGKNIRKELFYEYYDEHFVNEALQLLQKYSLIIIDTSNIDLEQTILIHSLLQYVIRTEGNQEYLHRFLDNILLPLNEGCDIRKESYGKYWYKQLAYMFHKNQDIVASRILKYLSELLMIFHSKREYFMFYQILIPFETFDYQDQRIGNIQDLIAQSLNKMGKYDEALNKYQEVENLQIKNLSYKHPSTLTTQYAIAKCLQDQGNYDGALIKFQDVEKLQMETFGNKHLSTLATQRAIAACLHYKGNYDEAIIKYQEVEKLLIETVGCKHPSTLTTQNNIATSLQHKGNYDEALIEYQKVEKLLIETIGSTHPSTLTIQYSIATCLHSKENYDQATIKYQEIEKLQIENIGYKHPSTLTTQHAIAKCLQDKGNYHEALIKFQKVEKLRIEIIGNKDPSTLATKHAIATCLKHKGDYNKALIKFQEVEKLQIETIGF